MFPRWFYISGIVFLFVIFGLYLRDKMTTGSPFTVKELLMWAVKFGVAYSVYVMFIRTPDSTVTMQQPTQTGGRKKGRVSA